MSEEAAYALLFPGRGDAGPVHADPDWARVHRELARTGVTLKLLHAEYADGCAEAGAPSMSYDRFCKRYRQYTVSRNVVSRVGHKAGRNMEVDWSGPTMRLVDPRPARSGRCTCSWPASRSAGTATSSRRST